MSGVREVGTSEIGREKKKKKSRAISAFKPSCCLFSLLNEDLIIDEILLKLPVNSLLRLRCVSRYFHSSITKPSFIRKHLHHNSSTAALLLISCRFTSCVSTTNPRNHRYNCYTFKEIFQHFSCNFNVVDDPSLPEFAEMPCPFELVGDHGSSVGIYGSCNGLLFLYRDNRKHSYIWNPCTKEYKEYSNPSIMQNDGPRYRSRIQNAEQRVSSDFCGFGYDRTNDDYKVLYYENRVRCLTEDEIRRSGNHLCFSEFKLYTLGSGTWKSISDSRYKSLFSKYPWRKRIGLLVNGALHWIMSSEPSSSNLSNCARNAMITATTSTIFSFDMEMEEFGEVQKPESSTRSLEEEEYYYEELQVLQECLCLCQFPESNNMGTFDIWMLKDYTVKDSWTKLFRIVMPNDVLPGGLLALQKLKLLRFCENGEIVMLLRGHGNHVILYEPLSNSRSTLVENIDETTKTNWEYAVVYKESLVSLNSGTYSI